MEASRGKASRSRSVVVHSTLGLILGVGLSLASIYGVTLKLGPKVWGVLGFLIIIVTYLPVYFALRRSGISTSVAEFLVYFIMSLGSWFSFYPFLLNIFK